MANTRSVEVRNCLVQSRTYTPTGNRDLEKISIVFLIQSVDLLHYAHGVGTGIKLQHGEPTFPEKSDILDDVGRFVFQESRNGA